VFLGIDEGFVYGEEVTIGPHPFTLQINSFLPVSQEFRIFLNNIYQSLAYFY
jgi:hypothetical protein